MKLLATFFTVFASLLLPLTASVWLSVKKKGYLKPILFGALTFFVFQVLLRLPLIQVVLPQMPWFTIMTVTSPVLTALFYGVTAALFEEGGRYIVMRLFLKNRQRTNDGIAFGIGHGGIEAILLVGINYLAVLFMNIDVGSGPLIMAAGAERIFTMVLHISWSVMVMRSVRNKKLGWLLIAFGLHTVVDTGVLLIQNLGVSTFAIEAIICVFALISLGYIIYEFKSNKEGATAQ
jgi:uncharacterized membrane protein YhfC